MLEVMQGATIVGKSGKQLLVERVDGDLIFCEGGVKIRREQVFDVIPPPHPKLQEDDRLLENILSVTETLLLVVGFSDMQAVEALTDLRQVWDKSLLAAAAKHLSTPDRDRLRDLVVKSNAIAKNKLK